MNKRFHHEVVGGFSLSVSKAQATLLVDLYGYAAGGPVPMRIASGRETRAYRLAEKGLIVDRLTGANCGYLDEGKLVEVAERGRHYHFTKAGLLTMELMLEAGLFPQETLRSVETAKSLNGEKMRFFNFEEPKEE